jgi:hypothetical protein
MFQHVLGTSLEHAVFPEHLEHALATAYFGDYVQSANRNQATHLRGCVAARVVAAWLLKSYQFP